MNNTVMMFSLPYGVDLEKLTAAHESIIRRVDKFPPAMLTLQTKRRPVRTVNNKGNKFCWVTSLIFRYGRVIVLGTVQTPKNTELEEEKAFQMALCVLDPGNEHCNN